MTHIVATYNRERTSIRVEVNGVTGRYLRDVDRVEWGDTERGGMVQSDAARVFVLDDYVQVVLIEEKPSRVLIGGAALRHCSTVTS